MAYLYRHIRLDKNVPFYIGIGVDNNYYRANTKKSRNNHWNSIVEKSDYELEILFEHDDYEFIKEKEIEFISLHGRSDLGLGTLCNKTNGGDGCVGLVHSDEAKLKMSLPNRGKIISEEHRRKISEFHKGIVRSKECREKISTANSADKNHMFGKKVSEETRARMIKSAKRGSENVTSKLTDEDVLNIRNMHKNKGYSHSKLAEMFNVSKSNILSIVNYKTWKHII
jgi:hypothetical protein